MNNVGKCDEKEACAYDDAKNGFLRNIIESGKVYRLYVGGYEKLAKKYNLTKCDIEVLIYLSMGKSENKCNDISEFWGISKALMSRSVESLFERNMIAIIPDVNDRRCMHLIPDTEAYPVIEELLEKRREFFENIMTGISDAEYEIFCRVLSTMHRNVENEIYGKQGQND